ncbi:MAG: signal peptidase I [Dermatophilaceae bacterium]
MPRRRAAPGRRRPGRRAPTEPERRPGRRRWLLAAGVCLLVMLLVRGFVAQSFSIASTSMQPTIEPGDRVLVSRLHRGPSVQRGDLVVFDGTAAFGTGSESNAGIAGQALRSMGSLFSLDTGTDYVKRVVGMPGDRVACCDASGRVTVNGIPLDEPYLYPGDAPSATHFDAVVPPGRIWVMGDHRSESGDSRSRLGHAGGGMVSLDDVVGTVWVRYWPVGRLGTVPRQALLPTVPTPSGAGQ